MTLDNLNRDIEEIINKWINKGMTEKEIQNSVVNVLKQKTNYDEDFIMLIDDKSDDNMSKRLLEMENHLNKIYSNQATDLGVEITEINNYVLASCLSTAAS